LGTGFSAKLLWFASVGLYPLIDKAFGEGRVVFPAVDVRADAVVIYVGVALFGHAQEEAVHVFQGLGDSSEGLVGGRGIFFGDGFDEVREDPERRSSRGFNSYVDEDEPLFIQAAEEVLDEGDVF
jgi:hypothetical protein